MNETLEQARERYRKEAASHGVVLSEAPEPVTQTRDKRRSLDKDYAASLEKDMPPRKPKPSLGYGLDAVSKFAKAPPVVKDLPVEEGPEGVMEGPMRSDGLDSPLSPNGPHPLYFVTEENGERHGPYPNPREAENNSKSEMAEITDHKGRPIHRERMEEADPMPPTGNAPQNGTPVPTGPGTPPMTPMQEAKKKFMDGLKEACDKDKPDATLSGADEGKPPMTPKAMGMQAMKKFSEGMACEGGEQTTTMEGAMSKFTEGMKEYCKKGK